MTDPVLRPSISVAATSLRLSTDQMHLLRHVRTFGITTREVVQRYVLTDSNEEATKSFLRRLVRRGLLKSAPLNSSSVYYYLTDKAFTLLGEPCRRTGALSPQPLVRALGILEFCIGTSKRTKLTRHQFRAAFPELAHRGLPTSNFFLDESSGATRLGPIYVECSASIDFIVRKLERRFMPRFIESDSWRREVLDTGRFVFAVVTPSETKSKHLRAALDDHLSGPWAAFGCFIEAAPNLLKILDRQR